MQNKKVDVTCEDCPAKDRCGYKYPFSNYVHICKNMNGYWNWSRWIQFYMKKLISVDGVDNFLIKHPNEEPWLEVPTARQRNRRSL